jgi:hypothetical protein
VAAGAIPGTYFVITSLILLEGEAKFDIFPYNLGTLWCTLVTMPILDLEYHTRKVENVQHFCFGVRS